MLLVKLKLKCQVFIASVKSLTIKVAVFKILIGPNKGEMCTEIAHFQDYTFLA